MRSARTIKTARYGPDSKLLKLAFLSILKLELVGIFEIFLEYVIVIVKSTLKCDRLERYV